MQNPLNLGPLIFVVKSIFVRDLRETYQYADCVRNGILVKCPGVYLWGRKETRSWMKTNILSGSNF
jgi:hypothetical protein